MFPLEPATASGYFETAGTEYGRTDYLRTELDSSWLLERWGVF